MLLVSHYYAMRAAAQSIKQLVSEGGQAQATARCCSWDQVVKFLVAGMGIWAGFT